MSVRHSKCADVHRDGDDGPGSQELLFEHVRVEGIPTRGDHLRVFLETQTCRHLLGRLDAAWPMLVLGDRDIARSGRPHRAARTLLGRLLGYRERLSATDNTLRRRGLTVPNWANSDEVADLHEAFAIVEAELAWQQTGVPLAYLTDQLDTWCRDSRAPSNLRELAERSRKTAVDDGDQPQ